MPFLLLLVLTLTYLQTSWPPPLFASDPLKIGASGPAGQLALASVLLTWGGAGFLMALAEWLVRCFSRAIREEPSQRQALARRFSAWRRYHLYALLVFHGVALYL